MLKPAQTRCNTQRRKCGKVGGDILWVLEGKRGELQGDAIESLFNQF